MPVVRIPWRSAAELMRTTARYRHILKATTEIELKKKFAGSVLGGAWVVLHPLLFLAIYLFLFLVVFKVRFPDMSELGYVVYVFAGLVPYLAFMEAMTAGTAAVKQNMHLVRNVIVPIDLIPVRIVLLVTATELVGLGVVVLLLAVDGTLSPWAITLPLVLTLQLAFILGLVCSVAALGVLLPDLGYAINLIMIFLMFISPIGFKVEALHGAAQGLVWLNPVHYMLEIFRSALISGHGPHWGAIVAFTLLAAASLALGAAVFRRFKGVIVDYE